MIKQFALLGSILTTLVLTASMCGKNNKPLQTSGSKPATHLVATVDSTGSDEFLTKIQAFEESSASSSKAQLTKIENLCDVGNLPAPLIQFGFPTGLKIIPVAFHNKRLSNFTGARVRVTGIPGTNAAGFKKESDLLGGSLASQDAFLIKDIAFDNKQVYLIEIIYQFGNTSCIYKTYFSDSIVWTDVVMKPATETTTCNFSCDLTTFNLPGTSDPNHSLVWTPINGQRIKITVGGVTHVYQYLSGTLVSLGKCKSTDPDPTKPGNGSADAVWDYPTHTIKHAMHQSSDGVISFRFSVNCSTGCTPTACIEQ